MLPLLLLLLLPPTALFQLDFWLIIVITTITTIAIMGSRIMISITICISSGAGTGVLLYALIQRILLTLPAIPLLLLCHDYDYEHDAKQ